MCEPSQAGYEFKKKLTLFYTLFVLIVYHAYVIFTQMALLQFTSILLNFLFIIFFRRLAVLERVSQPKPDYRRSRLPSPGPIPLSSQFVLFIHLIIFAVYLVSLLASLPFVFSFPEAPFQFPAFVLPHVSPLPVYLLGEL